MTAPQERPVVVVPARLGWANAERDKSSLRLYATDDGDSPRWDERWQGGYVVEYALPTNTGEGDRYLVVRLGDRFTDDAVTERVTAAIDAALYDAKAEPQERPVAGDGLDREAIERRAEAATPGPWKAWDTVPSPSVVYFEDGASFRVAVCSGWSNNAADAEFIAHARTDVPALLAALRAAEAEVERLRAENARIKWDAARRSPMRRLRAEGGAT